MNNFVMEIYTGQKHCTQCGWGIPQPGLSDAVLGYFECSECEHKLRVCNDDRREILDNFDQRLHVLDGQT